MGVRTIQSHIGKVLSGKNLTLVTPKNLEEEKKRFFSYRRRGERYEPSFSYRPIRFSTEKVQQEIHTLREYRGTYEGIIHRWAERCQHMLDIVTSRKSPAITIHTKKLYGEPSDETVAHAHRILTQHHEEADEGETYTPDEVRTRFEPTISHLGWRIAIVHMPSKMKIRYPQQTLFIKEGATFTKKEVRRLRSHEIGTHLQRYINTMQLPAIIRECFDHIETEEGLAVVMEERNGALSHRQLRTYAARVMAVHLSLTQPFSEVFRRLVQYGLDEETVFSATARAKRGLGETEKAGAFTKDHIYLTGKLRVETFLSGGGSLEDLFLGKIGIDDIPEVKRIMGNQATRSRLTFLTP